MFSTITYTLALFLIISGYHVHGVALNSGYYIPTFAERVGDFLERKCLKNAGQVELKEVLKELETLKDECFSLSIGPRGLTDEELTNLCRSHTENVTQCLIRFGKKLQPCLHTYERYLEKFIVDVYNSSAAYYCDNIKLLSVSELLSTDTMKCVTKINENPQINPHRVCYENSTVFGDEFGEDYTTKEEICGDLMNANFCYEDLLREHCPDSVEVREFQKGLLVAALNDCAPLLFRGTTEVSEDATKPTEATK